MLVTRQREVGKDHSGVKRGEAAGGEALGDRPGELRRAREDGAGDAGRLRASGEGREDLLRHWFMGDWAAVSEAVVAARAARYPQPQIAAAAAAAASAACVTAAGRAEPCWAAPAARSAACAICSMRGGVG